MGKKMNVNKALSIKLVTAFGAVLALAYLCMDSLVRMVGYWDREEYSHGYMIPLVMFYLMWQKRVQFVNSITDSSPYSVAFVGVTLTAWLLGELSGIFTIIQYAFILGLLSITYVWLLYIFNTCTAICTKNRNEPEPR